MNSETRKDSVREGAVAEERPAVAVEDPESLVPDQSEGNAAEDTAETDSENVRDVADASECHRLPDHGRVA